MRHVQELYIEESQIDKMNLLVLMVYKPKLGYSSPYTR